MALRLNRGNDRRRLREQLRSISRHELARVLVVSLLVVVGIWAVIELAGDVFESDTKAFDRWVVNALRHPEDPAMPRGPRWLVEVGRDITALGSNAVLILVTTAVAGALLLQRKYRAMWFLVITAVSGGVLTYMLKGFFARERPFPELYVWVITTGFPSAHAMLGAVVYLTLGILLAHIEPRPWLKVYFFGVMMALTFLVGISRVYLGVHYPTDVLTGWMLGLVWASLCWLAAWYLERRGDRIGRIG